MRRVPVYLRSIDIDTKTHSIAPHNIYIFSPLIVYFCSDTDNFLAIFYLISYFGSSLFIPASQCCSGSFGSSLELAIRLCGSFFLYWDLESAMPQEKKSEV